MGFHFPKQFFVTGTDTDIGKTLVSAMLVQGLKAGYWKPIQSGLEETTDTEFIQQITQLPKNHFFPEQYRLQTPLSPHASAKIDGVQISLDQFKLPQHSFPHLIVEGAGGVLVPMNEKDLVLDLMVQLSLPVLIVARSGLGTINHTLLTIEMIRSRQLPILGVVLSGEQNQSNKEAIEHYGKVDVIAEIPMLENVDLDSLEKQFQRSFEI
ncbi:MAG: dethiobiotin synthetase [bacterium]|jgi:dethiobiotin synthetase